MKDTNFNNVRAQESMHSDGTLLLSSQDSLFMTHDAQRCVPCPYKIACIWYNHSSLHHITREYLHIPTCVFLYGSWFTWLSWTVDSKN